MIEHVYAGPPVLIAREGVVQLRYLPYHLSCHTHDTRSLCFATLVSSIYTQERCLHIQLCTLQRESAQETRHTSSWMEGLRRTLAGLQGLGASSQARYEPVSVAVGPCSLHGGHWPSLRAVPGRVSSLPAAQVLGP